METREVNVRPLGQPGDLGWVVMTHGESYHRELGLDTSFEALVAQIVADYANERVPGPQQAWIAEVDGVRAGCIVCIRADDRTAQLRLLLVNSVARGLGLGSHLVKQCVDFARSAGYEGITLLTDQVLGPAQRIYQAHGFELVDEKPYDAFGQHMLGQTWYRSL
jgi:GNAT superfamily N-acetyltransferase